MQDQELDGGREIVGAGLLHGEADPPADLSRVRTMSNPAT